MPSIICTNVVCHPFNSVTNIVATITLFCTVSETCSFNTVVIFVFSTNTSLTFFPNAFPEAVLSVPHSCRQLVLLLEFCKLFTSQYLLSNIFNGIRDEIKVFFSLISFLKNWVSLSKLFMWSFNEFITLESRWYVVLGGYCFFKSGKIFCFKWLIAT